jgi:hypothetical protein
LQRQIDKLELQVSEKENLISDLQYQVETKDRELYQYQYNDYNPPKQKGVSSASFFFVLIIALGLGGYNIYNSVIKPYQDDQVDTSSRVNSKINYSIDSSLLPKTKQPLKKIKTKLKKPAVPASDLRNDPTGKEGDGVNTVSNNTNASKANRYKVKSTAYFYDSPDEKSWRDEYLTANKAIFTALQEKNNFIYVMFINSEGETTKGWLSKKQLSRVF